VRGFVGDAVSDAATTAGETRRRAPRVPTKPLELPVEVVCGDIRKVAGDVYAVGHYVGVLPQCAEAALDRVVSPKNAPEEDRVLNSFTRRGVLRGELGAVDLFPWADGSGRQVAVAGMGHPGSFGRAELRRLGQSLTAALTALPRVRTVCAVLIGSGVGNLRVREAVDGLLVGAADALRRERKGGSLGRLKIVELDLVKAHEIQAELKRLADDKSFAQVLKLKLSRRVTVHPSARLCQGFSLSLALAGLATGASAKAGSSQRRAVDAFLRSLPGGAKARREVLRNLGRVVPPGLVRRTSPHASRWWSTTRARELPRRGGSCRRGLAACATATCCVSPPYRTPPWCRSGRCASTSRSSTSLRQAPPIRQPTAPPTWGAHRTSAHPT